MRISRRAGHPGWTCASTASALGRAHHPGSSSAAIYVGQVSPDRAGKTLLVDLYDVGDGTAGSQPIQIQLLAPPSGGGVAPSAGTSVSCAYNHVGAVSFGPPTPDVSSNCTITTVPANSSTGLYDGKWLRIVVQIPTAYTCTGDCYWFLRYSFGPGGTTSDRLTWIMNASR